MDKKYETFAHELRKSRGGHLSEKGLEELCKVMGITDETERRIMELINQDKSPEEILEILLKTDDGK